MRHWLPHHVQADALPVLQVVVGRGGTVSLAVQVVPRGEEGMVPGAGSGMASMDSNNHRSRTMIQHWHAVPK